MPCELQIVTTKIPEVIFGALFGVGYSKLFVRAFLKGAFH